MKMKKLIKQVFGKDRELKYEIFFGPDAASSGEHGVIIGTWLKNGWREPIAISFFFRGHEHAPKLNPEVIEELFHQAKSAGIVPTHLYSYDGLMSARGPVGRKRDSRNRW